MSALKESVAALRAALITRHTEALKTVDALEAQCGEIEEMTEGIFTLTKPRETAPPKTTRRPRKPREKSAAKPASPIPTPAVDRPVRVSVKPKVVEAIKNWASVEQIQAATGFEKPQIYSCLMAMKAANEVEDRGEHGSKEYRAK